MKTKTIVALWIVVLMTGVCIHGQKEKEKNYTIDDILFAKDIGQSKEEILKQIKQRLDKAPDTVTVKDDREVYLKLKEEGFDRGFIKSLMELLKASEKKRAEEAQWKSKGLPLLPSRLLEEAKPSEEVEPWATTAWAVLVGINAFKDTTINTLSCSVRDTELFAQYLLRLGVPARHILMLTDACATKDALEKCMKELSSNKEEKSVVYFYFSGHGAVAVQEPDKGYLVMHDTITENEARLKQSGYEMSILKTYLKDELKAQRTIVILDACHSGNAKSADTPCAVKMGPQDKKTMNLMKSIADTGKGQNRAKGTDEKPPQEIFVLTSSQENQKSWEDDKSRQGYFTYYLVKGLEGDADRIGKKDGRVTMNECFLYVLNNVSVATEGRQLPDRSFSWNWQESFSVPTLKTFVEPNSSAEPAAVSLPEPKQRIPEVKPLSEWTLKAEEFLHQEINELKQQGKMGTVSEADWGMIDLIKSHQEKKEYQDARKLIESYGFLEQEKTRDFWKRVMELLYGMELERLRALETDWGKIKEIAGKAKEQFPTNEQFQALEQEAIRENIPQEAKENYFKGKEKQHQKEWANALEYYQKSLPYANAHYRKKLEPEIAICRQNAYKEHIDQALRTYKEEKWDTCWQSIEKAKEYDSENRQVKALEEMLKKKLAEISISKVKLQISGPDKVNTGVPTSYSVQVENTGSMECGWTIIVLTLSAGLSCDGYETWKEPGKDKATVVRTGRKLKLYELQIPAKSQKTIAYEIKAVKEGTQTQEATAYFHDQPIATAQISLEAIKQDEPVYGLPSSVWNACQYNHQGEWMLDMTTDTWLGLSVGEQQKYASAYQEGYAKAKGLDVEKTVTKEFTNTVKKMKKVTKTVMEKVKKKGIKKGWFWDSEVEIEVEEPKQMEVEVPTEEIITEIAIATFTFRLIPPGRFWMGSLDGEKGRESDETRHRVVISKPFYICTTEVTQGQWKSVMGSDPPELCFKNAGADAPVERVSWDDCQGFFSKTGFQFPTEAQWEYACRSGVTRAYYWGDEIDGNYCWYGSNSGSTTHPVKEKSPNAWELYDMSGNVWEWCQDWYGDYPSSDTVDPAGAHTGSYRVYRGGGWDSSARSCRSSGRSLSALSYRYDHLGLRCVVLGSF